LAALAAGALVAPGAAGAAPCPNEALRADSPQLADCRAYEMVSPVDMNGNGLEQAFAVSPDGNALAYGTINVFGEAPSSVTGKWLAHRSATEWSSATANAPTLGRVPTAYDEPVALGFSADFSSALIGSRYPFDALDQAPYRNFVQSGNADIYKVLSGGREEWQSHGPVLPDTTEIDRGLSGASADLSKVLFQTKEVLLPGAKESTAQNLYEREGDQLRLVNLDESGKLIPGGAGTGRGLATAGSFYNGSEYQQGSTNQGHPFDPTAVSRDGSRVFFTAPLETAKGPSQLYVRLDAARTELISGCEVVGCAGEGAPDGALFLFAQPDGSAVTFYSPDRLIESAPAEGGIYRFDVATKALTFLTEVNVTTNLGVHDGGLLAASEDGSYLYLCEGGTELAVYHAGKRQTIAPIPCDAAGLPSGAEEPTSGRSGIKFAGAGGITQGEPSITSNAGYLFTTTAAMGNGYPNEGHAEVYRYDTATASLHCLSCRADGAPAQEDSFLNKGAPRPEKTFVSIVSPVTQGVSVRNLSASGDRAFFVSEEALVSSDTDESQDVYEWEAVGSGSCAPGGVGYVAAAAGCVSLVSSGDGAEGAVFEGSSENGDDVFFASYESLVPADTGTELQLYDARVGGGLIAQHQVPATPCGDARECRGAGAGAPASVTAATAHYKGHAKSRRKACAAPRKQAKALRAKAKAARKAASRARAHDQRGKAKRMETKGRKLAKKAGRLARQAKRCTGSNRRAAK
jgi:hypothetical protein